MPYPGGQQPQQGGGPGVQTPHPTVPYGQGENNGGGGGNLPSFMQQGQPQGQGQNPGQPQGQPQGQNFGQPQGQQQVPQPHPTVPYGQNFGQQPQGQPQGQAQPQGGPTPQPVGGVQLSDDTILDGPSVPPELRGRTFGQVKSIYTALATDWLQRQRGGQNGGPQPQSQNQQIQNAGPQPTPRFQGGSNQQQQDSGDDEGWDWSDPRKAIRREVQDVVNSALQPVVEQATGNRVAQARAIAQQQIRDFAQLEGHIMQRIGNLDPSALTDPNVWVNAARLVRGELMERGMYQAQGGDSQNSQQPQGGQPQPQPQIPSQGFPRSVPAQPHQFFTESPTPPSVHEYGAGGLSPAERQVAQAMGISEQEYIAWKGGVSR